MARRIQIPSNGAYLDDALPSAFSRAKKQVELGLSVTILIISDSLGDQASSPRETPYLFADALVPMHPTHGVVISAWDNTSSSYATTTRLSTGTTSADITIWNAAVSGTPCQYFMGEIWPKVGRVLAPDVCIFNHGKNHVSAGGSLSAAQTLGEMLAALEHMRLYHPETPIAWILQPTDIVYATGIATAVMEAAWTAIKQMAVLRDITLIDCAAPFATLADIKSVFADDRHPNAAGQALMVRPIIDAWIAGYPLPVIPTRSMFATRAGDNLLANGDFSKWTTPSSPPDGWTAAGGGTLTISQETTIVADERAGRSLKLEGATADTYITQSLPSTIYTPLRGQVVTLSALRYIGSTNTATTAGRMRTAAGSPALGTQLEATRAYAIQQGGWVWWVLSGIKVPTDCTSFAVRLHHDTATSSPWASPVYWDQVCLRPGYLPGAAR